MMMAIMLYMLVTGCLVAAAAAAAGFVLAALKWPQRGLWFCALVASAALPAFALLAGGALDRETTAAAVGGMESSAEPLPNTDGLAATHAGDRQQWAAWSEWRGLSELRAWSDWIRWNELRNRTVWPTSPELDGVLLALWLAGSAVVLLALGGGGLAVRRGVRRLPTGRLNGTEVAISERLGPAVFGLLEPRIIVPRWLAESSSEILSTALRHEREHVAAGDTRLLAAAVLCVALVPWNPAMWWQLRRMRAAVEFDCDARVTQSGTDAGVYAQVLLAVAQRRASISSARTLLGAVALSETVSELERRVLRLLEPRKSSRPLAFVGASAAAMMLAAACAVQPPDREAAVEPGIEAPRALRQPITDLDLGGERVVVLVDVSVGMLDRTREGVAQRMALPAEQQRRSPKWTHLVDTVREVTRQIAPGTRFQVIAFNDEARSVIADTDGQWLTATSELLARSVDALRSETVPEGRSNLRAAFEAAQALQPPADTVHLIVDGLPTAGESIDAVRTEQERMQLFDDAVAAAPTDAAINVILMPKENEPAAAPAYWVLAQRTGGSVFAPAEGGSTGPVPGVALDSEYLVFVVDSSGSMRQYGWNAVLRHLTQILDLHPSVRGFNILNDEGFYLLEQYRGAWIPNDAAGRTEALYVFESWSAFSASRPVAGIVTALEELYEPGRDAAIFVYGDDLATGSVDDAVALIERSNRESDTGRRKMRISAVALPVYLEVAGSLLSAAHYAALMRELSQRHGGAFIALSSL